MSYSSNLQARANACKQYADEGACLARIARFAPVTIVPGFSGLGQTDSISTVAAHSAHLIAIQQALMAAGLLNIRTADGVISSSSSATLTAIRSWATARGLSATGTARSSGGGLTIPTSLMSGIIGGGGGGGGGGASATTGGGGKTGAATAAEPSSVLPSFTADDSGGYPSWLPWAGGAAALLVVAAVVMRRR